MLESLILGIVYDEDLTGYDIKKNIEKSFGVFYKASFGSLYPALKRLTGKDFVTTYEQPQGGRQKIFYHITEEGKSSFLEWLSSPMNILDGTNLNLAKVYFFDRLPTEIRETQLLLYENNNISYLRELEALEKSLSHMDHLDSCYYKMSTLYYGISVTEKTIEWCRHIREGKVLKELTAK